MKSSRKAVNKKQKKEINSNKQNAKNPTTYKKSWEKEYAIISVCIIVVTTVSFLNAVINFIEGENAIGIQLLIISLFGYGITYKLIKEKDIKKYKKSILSFFIIFILSNMYY